MSDDAEEAAMEEIPMTPSPAPVEAIPWQPLVDEPYEVTKGYAVDAAAASAPTQFVSVAWLLNSAPIEPNFKTKLALSVLNDLLLGLPSAGLQKPLLESRLGTCTPSASTCNLQLVARNS